MKKILLLASAAVLACGSAFAETVVYDFTNFVEGETRLAQWPEIGNAWISCNPANEGAPYTITNENTSITFEYNGGGSAGQFRASYSTVNKVKYANLQVGKSMMFTVKPTEDNYVITQVVVQGNANRPDGGLVDGLTTTAASGTLVYDDATKSAIWTTSAPGVDCVIDANAGAYMTSITVTLEKTELKPADIAWSEQECKVVLKGEYNLPVLSRATDAVVNYSSSNEEVATIDATGAVNIIAAGTTVITASCEANATYDWGEASYTLNVMPEGYLCAVYDFTTYTGDSGKPASAEFPEITNAWWTTNPEDEGSYTSGNHFTPLTISKDNTHITFTANGGHGNVRTTNNKQICLQLGSGAMMTITLDNQYSFLDVKLQANTKITDSKVAQITTPAESGTVEFNPTTKVLTWLPAENTIACVFDVSGGAYIETITVEYLKKKVQSGVEEIAVDTDAPAVYYNLQGIRVENPGTGLYIRRQGNRTDKVKF